MTEKQAIAPLARAPTTTCNTPIARLIEKMFAQGCEPAAIISAVEAIEQLKPIGDSLTMRGARLSESWQPSVGDIAYALDRGMPRECIAVEAEKFRNYWIAKTGSGATKHDWGATWRNWIIKATEHGASFNPGSAELFQLPDVRRPAQMPSLPAWVASRVALIKDESRPDSEGKYRMIPTLVRNLILSEAERDKVGRHIRELEALCGPTPIDSSEAEGAMLIELAKMMLVLPTASQNEASAEARAEAYLVALDDVPVWAVRSAIRLWHRGECGKDARGEPFDYHWPPAAADCVPSPSRSFGTSSAESVNCAAC